MNGIKLQGVIVHGDRIGRSIGFPTANISTADPLPAGGAYLARMRWDDGDGYGILNIGTRPTVGGTETRVEIHLMDFKGNLYGKKVEVQLLRFMREEHKFDSLHTLRQQLRHDLQQAGLLLAELESGTKKIFND